MYPEAVPAGAAPLGSEKPGIRKKSYLLDCFDWTPYALWVSRYGGPLARKEVEPSGLWLVKWESSLSVFSL